MVTQAGFIHKQVCMMMMRTTCLISRFYFGEGIYPAGFSDRCIVTDPKLQFSKEVLDDLRENQAKRGYSSIRVSCAGLSGSTIKKMHGKFLEVIARS